MQSELRKILRDHCDHSCVMRTGRDFAENDIFALNKQFDPENTAAAERLRDFACNLACLFFGNRVHCLWLPGFTIVAVNLYVSDRF